ncbi:MAG: VWA domain-containing protein [Verrucomicrobia bacterium]|nr:VWA domain-containing protein [Verrucomicrobiota bacterium]
MNTSPSDPSDRLLDSLLREQHRGAPDEALLADIEKALDAAPARSAKPAVKSKPPRRKSRVVPMAVAATITLGVGTLLWWNPKARTTLGMSTGEQANSASMERLRLDYPPELIEGTPKPMILPGQTPGRSERHAPPDDGYAFAVRENEAALSSPKPTVPPPPQPVPPPPPADSGLRPIERVPVPQVEAKEVADARRALREINEVRGKLSRIDTGLPDPLDEAAEKYQKVIDDANNANRPPVPSGGFNRDQYDRLTDQPWKSPLQDALSTFSVDVDAASYTNVRGRIMAGQAVSPDAVRIEEFVNYFDYRYAPPKDGSAFALGGVLATCPWQPQHLLARVTIKGREIANHARPASNLVFLIDVSGSMQDPMKLPLLKRSLRVLLDQLDERDHLGIAVYAGSEGMVLPPTALDANGIARAVSALEALGAGGSTNGGAGLRLAYAMAAQNLVKGGVNRVILATDGDFNVGVTGKGDLVDLVKSEAAKGVSLTVLGFGTGNLNDAMMEAISNDGNGNYYYVDQEAEARRVFQQKLTGTLVTIAKDVKIQVEFNPGKVKAYRLIGYANRILRHEDFNNDKVDAGDIGAGHTVTAFYEIVPQGVEGPNVGGVDPLRYQKPTDERQPVASDEWFTLKLRHKQPDGDVSAKIETVMTGAPTAWERTDTDFQFASAVALCGMKLRQTAEVADVSWQRVEELARPGLTDDPQEQRAGFVEMLRRLKN